MTPAASAPRGTAPALVRIADPVLARIFCRDAEPQVVAAQRRFRQPSLAGDIRGFIADIRSAPESHAFALMIGLIAGLAMVLVPAVIVGMVR